MTATILDNKHLLEQKQGQQEEYPFSLEEMKWAMESIAQAYKRLENGEAKQLLRRAKS